MRFLSGVLLVLLSTGALSHGADDSADRAAITRAVVSYVEAFNARDSQAVASHWSDAGAWLNRLTGERTTGRAAIERQFEELFAATGVLRLDVTVDEIRFVTDDVAVEEGIATLVEDSGVSESQYTAIHVRTDDGWRLDSVRETVAASQAGGSRREALAELEWMVGDWVDATNESTIETSCSWTSNRNFLTRSFRVVVAGELDLEGTQVVGWDPRSNSIRSWVFDSEGGFGEGVWSRNGDAWEVQLTQTLADGREAECVNVITPLSDDAFRWESVARAVDGEPLPDVGPTTVQRAQ